MKEHPHRQSRFLLVTTRPRRRSTAQLPASAFQSAISPESHPHWCKREPEIHQRPSSPDRHALAPRLHRQNRDQIAIAPASASAPHSRAFLHWRLSDDGPVQAESSRWAVIRKPSQRATSITDGGSVSGDRKLKESPLRLAPRRPQPPTMGFDNRAAD
jgi:hypothetical protein